MFSVTTKSLLLSQGFEIYTLIWTWLCVVTDFFGIFFMLSWSFYSNESIPGNFLGYFNIFGAIWLWKVAISVLLPIAFTLVAAIIIGFPLTFLTIIFDDSINTMVWLCVLICFGPIIAIMLALMIGLGAEVFCFTIFAILVYKNCTERVSRYDKTNVGKVINAMVKFIADGPGKYRVIRLLAVNNAIGDIKNLKNGKTAIVKYIDDLSDQQYTEIMKVRYYDIRENCNRSKNAHLFPKWKEEILATVDDLYLAMGYHECLGYNQTKDILQWIAFCIGVFVTGPIYVIGKLVQIFYPWIILSYLIYYDLFQVIDLFQLVMLSVYIGLQLILLLIGIRVCRINWWIWHIMPGENKIHLRRDIFNNIDVNVLLIKCRDWYNETFMIPIVYDIVVEKFGTDIGNVIMDYYNLLPSKEE